MLKSKGQFGIVNWHRRPREETVVFGHPRGPKTEMRIEADEVTSIVKPAGLLLNRTVALPPFHYGVVFQRGGRPLVQRLGYDEAVVATLPDSAVEAFAGVGNPFSLGPLKPGERVVDLGSGGGFDCSIAAGQSGLEVASWAST